MSLWPWWKGDCTHVSSSYSRNPQCTLVYKVEIITTLEDGPENISVNLNVAWCLIHSRCVVNGG